MPECATPTTMLLAHTARRRYAVRRDDVSSIALIDDANATQPTDSRGQPYITVELGALLDAADCGLPRRKRALLVPLRRRIIALLVADVELLATTVCPLPTLLAERTRQPWAIGSVSLEQDLFVQLDLRAVARSALLVQPPTHQDE